MPYTNSIIRLFVGLSIIILFVVNDCGKVPSQGTDEADLPLDTKLTLTATPTSIIGDNVTFTATFVPTKEIPTIGGDILFTDLTESQSVTITLDEKLTASAVFAFKDLGPHQITASYASNKYYKSAEGNFTQDVQLKSTSIALTVEEGCINTGGTMTLDAMVTPSNTKGAISFKQEDGSDLSGCEKMKFIGDPVSCKLPAEQTGELKFNAFFTPDDEAHYADSISNSLPVKINAPNSINVVLLPTPQILSSRNSLSSQKTKNSETESYDFYYDETASTSGFTLKFMAMGCFQDQPIAKQANDVVFNLTNLISNEEYILTSQGDSLPDTINCAAPTQNGDALELNCTGFRPTVKNFTMQFKLTAKSKNSNGFENQ